MDTELRDRLQKAVSTEAKGRQDQEAAAVAYVRAELRADYEQGRRDLTRIEQETSSILRELEALVAIINRLPAPVREGFSFKHYAEEITAPLQGGSIGDVHVVSVAESIRTGLRAYERLSYRDIHDADSRNAFLIITRGNLHRGDGALTGARSRLGQIKTHLDAWAKSRE